MGRPSSSGRASRQWSRWRLRQRRKWSKQEKLAREWELERRECLTVEERLLELEERADKAESELDWWRNWYKGMSETFALLEELHAPLKQWLYALGQGCPPAVRADHLCQRLRAQGSLSV